MPFDPNFDWGAGRGPLAMPQQPGLGQQAAEWGKRKALSAAINAAVPGGGLVAEGAQEFLPGVLGLKEGGKAKGGWWSYILGKGRAGEGASDFLKGKGLPKKAEKKQAGGMIPSYSPGPLGMQDMVSMAKDVGKGPLAGIKYKKQGGEVVDEVEVKFHGPSNKPE